MPKGILLVLSACLVWGLIFIVPGFMTSFSPLEVALSRYFFLGIISCVFLMGQGWKKWRSIPWSTWRTAWLFALIVNIFYYFALVTGLRYSDASVIAILMGISPITLSFYGNWRLKEGASKNLVIPCLFIAVGLGCVNWEAFATFSGAASWNYAFGLFCGLLALVAWNWYVVANAQFLKKHPHIASSDWSTIIGLATFSWVLMIIPIYFTLYPEAWSKFSQLSPEFYSFLIGGMVLGFGCSWLGYSLWNLGSQSLPMSLAGLLTIFETIFGVLFYYVFEWTFPTTLELLGMISILTGVCLNLLMPKQQARVQTI